MSAIGERIRNRRIQLGLSQEQLAERMGYKSRSAINKVEKSVNEVSQAKILGYAEALNTTTQYLLGMTSDPSPAIQKTIKDLQSEKVINAYWSADPTVRRAIDTLLGISEDN